MTEDEAIRKWCPFARTAVFQRRADGVFQPHKEGMFSFNRVAIAKEEGTKYHEGPCIASDCMAWRNQSETDGYCGLAGTPK